MENLNNTVAITELERKFLLTTTYAGFFSDNYDPDQYNSNLGDWYDERDYAQLMGCTMRQVKGVAGSLTKKGLIYMSFEGEPYGGGADTWVNFTEEGWKVITKILREEGKI